MDNGKDQFATAGLKEYIVLKETIYKIIGEDGSIRLFDLRALQHSTILYEDPNKRPLNHLTWNKIDHNKLATVAQDSNEVNIFVVFIRILGCYS